MVYRRSTTLRHKHTSRSLCAFGPISKSKPQTMLPMPLLLPFVVCFLFLFLPIFARSPSLPPSLPLLLPPAIMFGCRSDMDPMLFFIHFYYFPRQMMSLGTPRTTHHAPRTTHHAPRTTHHAPCVAHFLRQRLHGTPASLDTSGGLCSIPTRRKTGLNSPS